MSWQQGRLLSEHLAGQDGPAVVAVGPARVMVGTCSWTDPTLTEQTDWYPKRSMSAESRLRYYASQFSLVEVDGTYYRPPAYDLARSWVERTPPGFCFDVKAFALLTGHPVAPGVLWPDVKKLLQDKRSGKSRVYAHDFSPDVLDEAWSRFVGALGPLFEAGRLGAVLLQYPPWFVPSAANRDELSRLPRRLGELVGCVEFRSPAWLADDERSHTLGLLRELGLAHVVVDAPRSSGLGTVLEVTRPDLAVARFHGRSEGTWAARDLSAAERFRYLYSEAELLEWAVRARALAERASRVHLLMNNCYQDYGVRNAAELARLLSSL
ncbi:MAG: DUF72 domain-containing protein [Acidimicrobiales bacterium]